MDNPVFRTLGCISFNHVAFFILILLNTVIISVIVNCPFSMEYDLYVELYVFDLIDRLKMYLI